MITMKVVFLDIDGVLNYEHFVRSNDGVSDNFNLMGRFEWYISMFNRNCVMQLNRILRETGAKVVLSSSWRKMFDVETIQEFLEAKGFEGELIDKTPNHGQRPCRGEEIQEWLEDHPEVEAFVVLDDALDVYPHADRWVQTFYEGYGLTEECADKAIKLLKE